MSEQDRLGELIELCYRDPLAWAHAAYQWGHGALSSHDGPREWQSDTLRIIRDHLTNQESEHEPCRIAIASGHGVGKSSLIGMVVNWALSTCVDTRIVITANTDTQLQTKTAPEVGKWTRQSITARQFDVQATSIASLDRAHTRDWRASFVPWSKSNTEAFAGLHNQGRRILLVFDEASAIDDSVWEVAEGALTDENTQIIWLAFGNPTRNVGRFRDCFGKYKHRWHTRKIDSRTVPGTNKKQLQQWVDDYGEDSDFVRVRVRGEFPSASLNALLGPDDCERSSAIVLAPFSQDHAAVILGVDVARQGDDSSIIAKRQGASIEIARQLRVANTVLVGDTVANCADQHYADAVFVDESGGYGAGVIDHYRTNLGRDCVGVQFGGKPTHPQFFNKRTEMYWELAKWVKSGGKLPDDSELHEELCATEYYYQNDKIRLIDKDDVKELIGRSPDKADACALTFAHPVSPRNPITGQFHNQRPRDQAQRGHNPFDYR